MGWVVFTNPIQSNPTHAHPYLNLGGGGDANDVVSSVLKAYQPKRFVGFQGMVELFWTV